VHLEPRNQVRLAPLLARITQDGTKVTRVAVRAEGTIGSTQDGLVFQPSGLTDLYRLQLPAENAIHSRPGAIHAIEGTVDGAGTNRGPILKAASAVEIR
jgi:hypothetical protein